MAPKTKSSAGDAAEGSVTLTTTQLKLLQHVANNPRTTLQVDRQDLADFAGYPTSAAAATAWHGLRKKLGIVLETTAGGKGKNAAKGKKRALSTSPDDADDELQSPQPMVKRARKVRGEADLKKVAAEQSQVEETAEQTQAETEAETDLGSGRNGESELTQLDSE